MLSDHYLTEIFNDNRDPDADHPPVVGAAGGDAADGDDAAASASVQGVPVDEADEDAGGHANSGDPGKKDTAVGADVPGDDESASFGFGDGEDNQDTQHTLSQLNPKPARPPRTPPHPRSSVGGP